ncbi:oxidoreductase [Aliidongia dinghuensis]|uniref:Oxidoreductase n=1 Tax=Aliidongia dinghuensis TaxID=1867774 RepID=A0A8J3E1T7_9PROT|nr:NAD(P)-dependent oxidoreductase [Aliidongia dinghuensis]GGF02576.1 oxidoreductase [Aliidongia dinghuensis]
MDVGFIGLGKMGLAMARNIANAGHRVRVWNRSPLAAEAATGFEIAASPRDAFQADAVFTMLSDDAAIREVLLTPSILGDARPGVVHVVTATISLDFAGELAVAHAVAGVGYVSAPVFGRPDVAAAAQLTIVAAGAAVAVDRVRPLFDAIGRKTWVLGEDPKQANAAKIAGNMMIAMAVEAMAEAAVLARSNGLAPAAFFDLILETQFAGSRAYQSYSAKIASGDFEPGFRMRLGLKDLGLAAAAAEQAGKRLPQLAVLHAHMAEAVAAGLGDKDWSAIAEYGAGSNRGAGR